MGEQQQGPVVAHPQVIVRPEPSMGWHHPQRVAIITAPRTVGEDLAGGSEDGVDPTHEFVVAEDLGHGVPRVLSASGTPEVEPPAVLAGSHTDAAMDRVRHGVVQATHKSNGATVV